MLTALQATAGVVSTHNLLALNCALRFGRALRARNSAIRAELLGWLAKKWSVADRRQQSWTLEAQWYLGADQA